MKQEMGKLNVRICYKDCILKGMVSNKPISASFDIRADIRADIVRN